EGCPRGIRLSCPFSYWLELLRKRPVVSPRRVHERRCPVTMLTRFSHTSRTTSCTISVIRCALHVRVATEQCRAQRVPNVKRGQASVYSVAHASSAVTAPVS